MRNNELRNHTNYLIKEFKETINKQKRDNGQIWGIIDCLDTNKTLGCKIAHGFISKEVKQFIGGSKNV